MLTAHQSNRVCNALALLQCVASHPDTRSVDWLCHSVAYYLPLHCWTYLWTTLMLRSAFLLAHIPLYLYPFLHTVSKTRSHTVSHHDILLVPLAFPYQYIFRPFEYLRLTSLGVIGALVKTDEQEVSFCLSTFWDWLLITWMRLIWHVDQLE